MTPTDENTTALPADLPQDSRQLWLEAVEKMAENAELRKRIEFLERELAVNAFAGCHIH